MPLFQYFSWVGAFFLAALLAANWCASAPISPAPRSDVPLNQSINIRIHTDQKWPERVVFDTTRSTLAREAKADPATDIGGSKTPDQAARQPFEAFAEMTGVFNRPAPSTRLRSGRPRRLKEARYLTIARVLQRARASLSPIRFTSRQEEADAFAHEGGQLATELLRALPH